MGTHDMGGFSGPAAGSWGIIFLTTIIDGWAVVAAGLHYCLILMIIGTTTGVLVIRDATTAFTFLWVISCKNESNLSFTK